MSGFPTTSENSYGEHCQERQLVQVGRYLRSIRTKQGLSLQQVTKRTQIQPQQLRAIETGNWMRLPEAIYVKGFLKRYAQSLGLDGIAIAEGLAVPPATINPKLLNPSDFSARTSGAWSIVSKLVG